MAVGPPTKPGTENAVSLRWRRAGRAVEVAGWLSLAAALTVWVVLRAGDLWAPATLLMFGPRWFFAVPPVLLLPVAVVLRRKALRSVVPALLVAAGPVAGCCVPWGQLGPDPPAGPRLRVLTCNMHYAKVDQGPLDRLVEGARPDVVALQEWRDSAKSDVLLGNGWHVHQVPGLFLASRHPIRRAERHGDGSTGELGSVMRYELDTPDGTVTVFNLHLATPRGGLGALIGFDRRGLDEVRTNGELRWRQSEAVAAEAGRAAGPVLLTGDFNTPPESAIFRRVWSEYADAFSDAGWGWGYTFRAKWTGVRIDHVLVGGGGRATDCRVGPDVGSPHRPVLADLSWPANGSR
jgi:endonuclease/exonuclease/phosphatase (EEP) superfamily protein YafD